MLNTKQKAINRLREHLEQRNAMLLDEYAKTTERLFSESTNAEESELPTTSMEINTQLLGSCLAELQRLKWEEAAATAEISTSQVVEANAETQLQLQKVKSAIALAETDLRHNEQEAARLGKLRAQASISQSELAKQAEVVERLKVQLDALQKELKAAEAFHTAASRTELQGAKKRLAENKSRQEVVQKQLKQLQARELRLRHLAVRERAMERLLERSSLIEQQIVPLELKFAENEVLVKLFEEELANRKADAAGKTEVNNAVVPNE